MTIRITPSILLTAQPGPINDLYEEGNGHMLEAQRLNDLAREYGAGDSPMAVQRMKQDALLHLQAAGLCYQVAEALQRRLMAGQQVTIIGKMGAAS